MIPYSPLCSAFYNAYEKQDCFAHFYLFLVMNFFFEVERSSSMGQGCNGLGTSSRPFLGGRNCDNAPLVSCLVDWAFSRIAYHIFHASYASWVHQKCFPVCDYHTGPVHYCLEVLYGNISWAQKFSDPFSHPNRQFSLQAGAREIFAASCNYFIISGGKSRLFKLDGFCSPRASYRQIHCGIFPKNREISAHLHRPWQSQSTRAEHKMHLDRIGGKGRWPRKRRMIKQISTYSRRIFRNCVFTLCWKMSHLL